MNTLLLRGGRIIDPISNRDQTGDILIRDGLIDTVSNSSIDIDGDVIDCEGCIVAPGLIDIHVHFREPSSGRHEESIQSGAASAAHGGFTTVCTMPNTTPAMDSVESIEQTYSTAREVDLCNVLPTCCATVGRQGQQLAPIGAMCGAGAIAITDDGDVVASDEMMIASLLAAKEHDVPFMQHCQDPNMTVGGVMHAGHIQEELGLGAWPRIAEESIIKRDIVLNESIGASWHAQHLSSGGSVELIRQARARGLPISGEASPHHLLLTDACCKTIGTDAKMNPPLREQCDIDAIKEGIADGTIAILATDHAPHPVATKAVPFQEASFGVVGLDCALSLYAKALIDDGVISWMHMIAMMTVEPANLIRRPNLGSLREGGSADVTIIQPNTQTQIQKDNFATTGRNCPFEGWEVSVAPIATLFRGKITHHELGDRCNHCISTDIV